MQRDVERIKSSWAVQFDMSYTGGDVVGDARCFGHGGDPFKSD